MSVTGAQKRLQNRSCEWSHQAWKKSEQEQWRCNAEQEFVLHRMNQKERTLTDAIKWRFKGNEKCQDSQRPEPLRSPVRRASFSPEALYHEQIETLHCQQAEYHKRIEMPGNE